MSLLFSEHIKLSTNRYPPLPWFGICIGYTPLFTVKYRFSVTLRSYSFPNHNTIGNSTLRNLFYLVNGLNELIDMCTISFPTKFFNKTRQHINRTGIFVENGLLKLLSTFIRNFFKVVIPETRLTRHLNMHALNDRILLIKANFYKLHKF